MSKVLLFACAAVAVDVEAPKRLGSFLVLGDWGYDSNVHGNVKSGCQKAIARAMRDTQESLGDVKFVINLGDSFYPTGVGFPGKDSQWNSKWLDVYEKQLTDLPWFSVYGNHDYQGGDSCSCSYDNKGCAQVNANVSGFTMPDLSYYDTRYLKDMGIEIVALDLNAADYLDNTDLCQYSGCRDTCEAVLEKRKEDALSMLAVRSSESPANSLLVFSHYPTDYLTRAGYNDAMDQLSDNSNHNVYYFGGHRHNVDQSSKQSSISPNTNWLVGGGGGWGCDGWSSDDGTTNKQGFVVGEINEDSTVTTYSVLVNADECC